MKPTMKPGAKPKAKKGTLRRLFREVMAFYPVLMPVIIACIVFTAVISSVPAVFMQNVIALVEQNWQTGDWAGVSGQILQLVGLLAIFYALSLTSAFLYNQLLAILTQGLLKKLREKMFNKMQRLPVKYFDTHNHGDVMSYYTNDIDTLRQLVSQCLPQMLISGITVLTVFGVMLYYCLWLTLVVVIGVLLVTRVVKRSAAAPPNIS